MQPVQTIYEQAPPVVQDVHYGGMPYPQGYRSIRDWATSEGINHGPVFARYPQVQYQQPIVQPQYVHYQQPIVQPYETYAPQYETYAPQYVPQYQPRGFFDGW